ncbi:MAG: integration host factor subunit alpha [Rickettsiales bacterium]|jgi:integration host factor subunit alpha|nr:integration host factor subunit alpha [Rickettsiales bacterium]
MTEKSITRSDFAEIIHSMVGLSKAEGYAMTDLIFQEIADSLVRGEEVKISGFGTFKILNKRERMGRNPKTGAPAVISARRTVTFHPSAKLKKKANQ